MGKQGRQPGDVQRDGEQFGRARARGVDGRAQVARRDEVGAVVTCQGLCTELGARLETHEVAQEPGRMGAAADDNEQGRTV